MAGRGAPGADRVLWPYFYGFRFSQTANIDWR